MRQKGFVLSCIPIFFRRLFEVLIMTEFLQEFFSSATVDELEISILDILCLRNDSIILSELKGITVVKELQEGSCSSRSWRRYILAIVFQNLNNHPTRECPWLVKLAHSHPQLR